jgi:hypothetical protein
MQWILLSAVMVSALISCRAQTFSLRVGGNVSWQRWQQQNVNLKPQKIIGPHVGISITNMHLKNLASQLEAGYAVIGHGGYKDAFNSVPKERLKFISLGLMAKYQPIKNFNLLAGPQFSFFVGGQTNLGKEDLAIAMGAEYYFSEVVGIGGRFFLGLTDLNDAPPNPFNTTVLIQKSRVIQFSLIFRLPSHQLREYGF